MHPSGTSVGTARGGPWAILGALVLIVGMFALPASADTTSKPYTLTFGDSNELLTVGVVGTVHLVLTNASNPQELGSANIIPPAGISVDGSSLSSGNLVAGVIELRELALAPGASLGLTFTATASCDASYVPYAWGSIAKQSNDFSGEGNDFFNAGIDPASLVACSLAFTGQPASAEQDAVITGAAFDPAGPAVEVTVLDAAGNPLSAWSTDISVTHTGGAAGATLGGTTTRTGGGAVATFGDLAIDTPGGGYRLVASSGALPSATSTAFDIVGEVTRCTGGSCQSGTVGTGDTTADVSADASDGSILIVSVLPDSDAPELSCSGALSGDASDTVVFDVTDDGAAKVASVTWASPDGKHSQLDVCFSGPSPFTQADGSPAVLNGDFYEGILENCRGKGNPSNLPCVGERKKHQDGSVTLVIYAPPGDPRVRIG